jgi:hypothetical protein
MQEHIATFAYEIVKSMTVKSAERRGNGMKRIITAFVLILFSLLLTCSARGALAETVTPQPVENVCQIMQDVSEILEVIDQALPDIISSLTSVLGKLALAIGSFLGIRQLVKRPVREYRNDRSRSTDDDIQQATEMAQRPQSAQRKPAVRPRGQRQRA